MKGLLESDGTVGVPRQQRLIKGLHTVLGHALLYDAPYQLCFILIQKEFPYGLGRDHDLDRGHSSFPITPGHQPQGYYRLEAGGKQKSYLLVLVRREEGDNPVDRLGGIRSVKRAEYKVPRVRGGKGNRHCRLVTNLTYQYHVRILPKNTAQDLCKCNICFRINFNLTGFRQRCFNGILYCDDIMCKSVNLGYSPTNIIYS